MREAKCVNILGANVRITFIWRRQINDKNIFDLKFI